MFHFIEWYLAMFHFTEWYIALYPFIEWYVALSPFVEWVLVSSLILFHGSLFRVPAGSKELLPFFVHHIEHNLEYI